MNTYVQDVQYEETWTRQDVIATLNNLIKVCEDTREGFLQAAECVVSLSYKNIFIEYANQRDQFATELSHLVIYLDGEPDHGGTISAAIRRGWMEISATLTHLDNSIILEGCLNGEQAAKEAYEAAMETPLPINAFDAIQLQYEQIFRAHYRINNLKSVYQN